MRWVVELGSLMSFYSILEYIGTRRCTLQAPAPRFVLGLFAFTLATSEGILAPVTLEKLECVLMTTNEQRNKKEKGRAYTAATVMVIIEGVDTFAAACGQAVCIK